LGFAFCSREEAKAWWFSAVDSTQFDGIIISIFYFSLFEKKIHGFAWCQQFVHIVDLLFPKKATYLKFYGDILNIFWRKTVGENLTAIFILINKIYIFTWREEKG
jgi:hypothetical protein